MTDQTPSCQSCVNAVHQRGHSDKAVQSRVCQDVSGRVRLAHVSRVTPLLYRLPAQPARHNHCHHLAMKVLCILSLVLAAVSATHVDLAPELDRMAIVPEER